MQKAIRGKYNGFRFFMLSMVIFSRFMNYYNLINQHIIIMVEQIQQSRGSSSRGISNHTSRAGTC